MLASSAVLVVEELLQCCHGSYCDQEAFLVIAHSVNDIMLISIWAFVYRDRYQCTTVKLMMIIIFESYKLGVATLPPGRPAVCTSCYAVACIHGCTGGRNNPSTTRAILLLKYNIYMCHCISVLCRCYILIVGEQSQ